MRDKKKNSIYGNPEMQKLLDETKKNLKLFLEEERKFPDEDSTERDLEKTIGQLEELVKCYFLSRVEKDKIPPEFAHQVNNTISEISKVADSFEEELDSMLGEMKSILDEEE